MNHELPDIQAVLRKGRGTIDRISSIPWIIRKAKEFQKNIYLCLTDYTKAFYCVEHNKVSTILPEVGIPEHLTYLLRNLYAGQETTLRPGHGTKDLAKSIQGPPFSHMPLIWMTKKDNVSYPLPTKVTGVNRSESERHWWSASEIMCIIYIWQSPDFDLGPCSLPLTPYAYWQAQELIHLKWPWCCKRLKAGGEGDSRGGDGWMASLTQWTWIWVTLGGNSSFSPLSECLQMTVKMLGVLILSL